MASEATVIVKNISASTSDGEVRDFFVFCGKVTDIKITTDGDTKTAQVTFEKETAMKTALLLSNTQLGPNHIVINNVDGVPPADDLSPVHATNNGAKERDSDELTQEEKPRARILAEYLAHGYVVGDAAIERAIELDKAHNVSSRFVGTLQNLDAKYRATDRARATDQSYGLSEKANHLLTGLGSYFEKAGSTNTGRKIVKFYTDGSRQVQDIHTEARRLADLKKDMYGGSAYKAAGLERVFGQQKPKEETAAGAAAAPGAAAGAAPAPGTAAPAETTKTA